MEGTFHKFLRRLSHKEKPEERQFKRMCRELSSASQIAAALEFYHEKFAGPDDNISVAIIPSLVSLFNASITFFSANMKDSEPDFAFLDRCLGLFGKEKVFAKSWREIFLFVKNYLDARNGEIAGQAIAFSRTLFENKSFEQHLGSHDLIRDVFYLLFVEYDCIYADLVTENLVVVAEKGQDFESFYEAVLHSFASGEVKNFEKALKYVCNVCSFLKEETFLQKFFELVADQCLELDSFDFFVKLLDTNLDVCWRFLERECGSQKMKKQVMNSLIMILCDRKQLSGAASFDYILFSSKIALISQQRCLVECVLVQDETKRIDFLMSLIPPWDKGVDTSCFLVLMETISFTDDLMVSIISKADRQKLGGIIQNDHNVHKMISHLLKHLTEEFPSWPAITENVLYWVNENVDGAVEWLDILTEDPMAEHVTVLASSLIDLASHETVCDAIWTGLAKICIANNDFVQVILKLGVDAVMAQIRTNASLDFLAAFVCNGPYKVVDVYIHQHKEMFAQLEEKQLRNVMMGLSQDSQSFGLLRIPSLCQFVPNCELSTPFDKYIYGKYGTKYCTEKRLDYLSQYIDGMQDATAEFICAATDVTFPHFPIYQFHFDMPHAVAEVETEASVSFWFYIERIIGKTVIASSSSGEISFDCDGLTIYGQPAIECSFRTWHMITMNFSEPKAILNLGCVYLDGVRMVQKGSTEYGPKKITFGSENCNNAIWFLAPNIVTSKTMLSKEQIDKLLESPPVYQNECDLRIERVSPGCKYVDYHGLIVFLEGWGGEEGIFMRLREEKDEKDFWYLLKAAFWLLSAKALSKPFFISAVRYVVIEHKEWFNDEKLVQTFGEDLNALILFLCDFQILSCPSFTFSYFPDLFSRQLPVQNLFCFVLDAYCFFDLAETVQANFVASIRSFVVECPEYLPKLLLATAGLPHIESDDVAATYDEKVEMRQNNIFSIALDYPDVLFSYVSYERCLDFCSVMDSKYACRLFIAMTKHVLRHYDYFSLPTFKANTALIVSLLQDDDDMWLALASLMVGTEVKSWDSPDSSLRVKTKKVLKVILDILASSIHSKMLCQVFPATELKVIRFIDDVAGVAVLRTMPEGLVRICSLGYDCMPDVSLSRTQSGRAKSPVNKPVNPLRYGRLLKLDPSGCDACLTKLEETEVIAPFERPKPIEVPENLSEVIDSDEMKIVANALAAALVVKIKSFMPSEKKVFCRYTISSTNVFYPVGVAMHQHVVKSILELPANSLTDDMWSLFFDFLSTRVSDRMWDGHEDELARMLLPRVSTKVKHAKGLLLTCIGECSSETQIELLTQCFSAANFVELLKDQTFFTSVQRLVCKTELQSEPGFETLKQLMVDVCKDTEFAKAIEEDRLLIWFAMREENIAKLPTTSSTQEWPSFASDTKKKAYQLDFSIRVRVTEATYLRRAMRAQFFYRLTKSNQDIEYAIGRIFRSQVVLERTYKEATKFMIVEAPQPFCCPQKMVPLVYTFLPPEVRVSRRLSIPHSIQKSTFDSPIPELNRDRIAPLCLENWHLPTYIPSSATVLVKELLGPQLSNCSFMSTPEELFCVYSLGKDSIDILMNATYDPDTDKVVLNELSDMLCHFAAFELPLYGYYGNFRLFCHHVILSFRYCDILLVINRRYAYRPTLVDVFLVNGIHHSINFASESDRKAFISKIKTERKQSVNFGIHYSVQVLSKSLDTVTKLWQKGEISNYDYLIYLNISGGRSFNDLAQYPVVPWVLGDFDKDEPVQARNLAKPMGAQTEERAKRFMANFRETGYHYGTHYSHSAAVLHYMLRMEPYTLYGVHLHNGWDHKDRLFCSVAESWRSASEANQADVKELIPEFYCFPSMFENVNQMELHSRSDGHSLNTVELPRWAKSSEHFVWEMRNALDESDNIHQWIDLIFGCKQRGEAGIEAVNLFHPLAYDDSLVGGEYAETEKRAAIDTINNFGQCPMRLFTTEHPARELEQRLTLANSEFYVTQLTTPQKVPKLVYVCDDTIVDSYDTELSYDYPIKTVMITTMTVTSYCLSTDRTLYALSRSNFTIRIYSCNGLITTILTRTNNITHMALSSQHAILAAADDKQLCLFDVGTGILMRSTTLKDPVVTVAFDEICNFVLVVTTTGLVVFGLDLRVIAESPSEIGITCVSPGDSPVRERFPFYFTGHSDGSICKWTLDVINSTLESSIFAKNGVAPVTAIHVFCESQALIAVNEEGIRALYSVRTLRKRLLKASYFEVCAACGAKSNPYCCSVCGLWICANCRHKRLTVVCKRCAGADTTPSSAREASGSGSSSGSKTGQEDE